MELGKIQTLEIARKKDFGVYLVDVGDYDTKGGVLLPIRQVPKDAQIGDKLEVFLYKDSEDRLIATTKQPKLCVGELAALRVKEVSKIGAFVDIGIDKDILLPFKEMEGSPKPADEVLMALYVDRSDRLALSMRIYKYLQPSQEHKKDDVVKARVYRLRDVGVMLAVEDKYFGMIPRIENYESYRIGDVIEARVLRVREDGKLDLSHRKKAYLQLGEDAKMIADLLDKKQGRLELGDDSSPEKIKEVLGISKNAFKRAIGNLYKSNKIKIYEDHIEKI
jgi:yitL protein